MDIENKQIFKQKIVNRFEDNIQHLRMLMKDHEDAIIDYNEKIEECRSLDIKYLMEIEVYEEALKKLKD